MLSIGELIKAALNGVSCGPPYPGVAPDDSPGPYVVMPTFFGTPQQALDGELDLQDRQVQLDCYAESYLAADQLAQEVIAALRLQTHNGSPSSFTASAIAKEYFGVDSDVKLHRVMVEFTMWYRQ